MIIRRPAGPPGGGWVAGIPADRNAADCATPGAAGSTASPRPRPDSYLPELLAALVAPGGVLRGTAAVSVARPRRDWPAC